MWQDLIDTLDKLGSIYDDLAELGAKKHAVLINVDMKNLSELLDNEKLLTTEIQKLEQHRIELFRDLSKSNTSETTSAKAFYKTAPSPVADKLLAVHERLVKNVQRTLKIRDDNQVLAQCALDATQMRLNKLGGATIEPNYSDKGSDIVTHQKNFDFMA